MDIYKFNSIPYVNDLSICLSGVRVDLNFSDASIFWLRSRSPDQVFPNLLQSMSICARHVLSYESSIVTSANFLYRSSIAIAFAVMESNRLPVDISKSRWERVP